MMAAMAGIPCAGQTQVAPAGEKASTEAPLDPALADAEADIVKSDWKAAETKLAAYLVAHPDDARALFDAGYAADSMNDTEQAAAYYQRAVKADPKSFEAQLSLGLVRARQGKMDEARDALTAATQLDPGEAGAAAKARAWRALARIDRPSNPATASNDLLEALKLSPETTEDTLLAAELAEAAHEPDAAEAAYRRVLAKDANNVQAQSGLAQVLITKKMYPEAEDLARKGLAQSPDDPGLTAELAAALAAQDKPEALPLLDKLHQAHPEDENITRMLAEVMADEGDAVAADKLYVELLAKTPNDPALLIAHGQNLSRQLKYAQAAEVFTKATELRPEDPDGWSGLAFAAYKTGHPSITLHALTMRSKYVPENASTYFLWATSYDTLHDRNAAITYYHHFLEAAAGKFPDQEWQARQRLLLLEKKP